AVGDHLRLYVQREQGVAKRGGHGRCFSFARGVRSVAGTRCCTCGNKDEMTQPPRMDVTSVTIGAPDPRTLAAFYARLLGWPVTHEDPPRHGEPPEDGWAQVRPPSGRIG